MFLTFDIDITHRTMNHLWLILYSQPLWQKIT